MLACICSVLIVWYSFGIAALGYLLSILALFVLIPLVGSRLTIDQSRWSAATDRRVKLFTSVGIPVFYAIQADC